MFIEVAKDLLSLVLLIGSDLGVARLELLVLTLELSRDLLVLVADYFCFLPAILVV